MVAAKEGALRPWEKGYEFPHRDLRIDRRGHVRHIVGCALRDGNRHDTATTPPALIAPRHRDDTANVIRPNA
jgi:hypothetical protein